MQPVVVMASKEERYNVLVMYSCPSNVPIMDSSTGQSRISNVHVFECMPSKAVQCVLF